MHHSTTPGYKEKAPLLALGANNAVRDGCRSEAMSGWIGWDLISPGGAGYRAPYSANDTVKVLMAVLLSIVHSSAGDVKVKILEYFDLRIQYISPQQCQW